LNSTSEPPALPPQEIRRGTGGLLTALLVINIFLFGILQAGLILVVPVFAAMFVDFGARLPAPTQFFIDFASFNKKRWWCYSAVIGAMAFLAFNLSNRTGRNCLIIAALIQFFLALALILSLVLPISQLKAVGGSP
jgi:type II secretory pathway component PulF